MKLFQGDYFELPRLENEAWAIHLAAWREVCPDGHLGWTGHARISGRPIVFDGPSPLPRGDGRSFLRWFTGLEEPEFLALATGTEKMRSASGRSEHLVWRDLGLEAARSALVTRLLGDGVLKSENRSAFDRVVLVPFASAEAFCDFYADALREYRDSCRRR